MENKKVKILAVLKPKMPYYDFSLQELKSLMCLNGIDVIRAFEYEYRLQNKEPPKKYLDIKRSDLERQHFVRLEIDEYQVPLLQNIIDRSVMIKTFLKLFGNGRDVEDLIKNIDLNEFQQEVDSTETFYFNITAEFRSMK